ncbi:MAG: hypothetical protein R3A10_08240 [Caldilineaceae bacterium]
MKPGHRRPTQLCRTHPVEYRATVRQSLRNCHMNSGAERRHRNREPEIATKPGFLEKPVCHRKDLCGSLSTRRRKYHGGNSALVPLVETVGPFPPGFTSSIHRERSLVMMFVSRHTVRQWGAVGLALVLLFLSARFIAAQEADADQSAPAGAVIAGRAESGSAALYRLVGLKAGDTLYADVTRTSGDLDPMLFLLPGDTDARAAGRALLEAGRGK